jgi:hypothetical protein
MEEAMDVTFHDSFKDSINVPCQELFGRSCPYCDEEGLRTRTQYIWSVWDYEDKQVRLFMFPVNNCSPIPSLMAMYENYGTLTDRDYIITVTGKQKDKAYSVVPMDKVKFRNEKAKPYSEQQVKKLLDKAYPAEETDEDDDLDEEVPKKKKTARKKVEGEEDDYDGIPFKDEETEYSQMSPKELFNLCQEREIEAEKRKPAKYYINLLEEWDEAQDEWGDEDDLDDDDEWEDD